MGQWIDRKNFEKYDRKNPRLLWKTVSINTNIVLI